ncbi:MAG: elongation factor P [Elusimicrobia bacterium]|nr:elongation factor P [Candidatus Liberimonas magnetica]
MISTSDIKNGANIFVEKQPCTVIWFQHHKPGKGGAMLRTKLKNLRTGAIVERTFKSGERFDEVDVEQRKKQYLYADNDNFYFMDAETYEQIGFPKEKMKLEGSYLTENLEVTALYLEGELVNITLPLSVVLTVTGTVVGAKGDTVSGATKPATVETGLEVMVPLFIKEGDKIRVDTRTGEYLERA